MRNLTWLIALAVFVFSGSAFGAEKRLYMGGLWYIQQADGTLAECRECNAGRVVPTVAESAPDDCLSGYPCQLIRPQFRQSKPVQAVEQSESIPTFSACISGNCGGASAGYGSSKSRPIRGFFSRLFGGCGG